MIQVRKILHTDEYDDISERFDFDGTLDQLKEAIQPALERPSRYTFYYLEDGSENWVKITRN